MKDYGNYWTIINGKNKGSVGEGIFKNISN